METELPLESGPLSVMSTTSAPIDFEEVCIKLAPVVGLWCFSCGRVPTFVYRERVEIPVEYPYDARAFVSAYLKDGRVAVCGNCRMGLGRVKKVGAIADQLVATAFHGAGSTADMPGWWLLGALLEHAWLRTRDPQLFGRQHPTLAMSLELMRLFPIAPALSHERVGLLSLATRDLGDEVGVTIGSRVDELYLADFFSLDRGKGHAKAAIQKLCDLADRHGVRMAGVVRSHTEKGGTGPFLNEDQLFAFYVKCGFVEAGEHKGYRKVARIPKKTVIP